jgi:hypothetical protein
MLYKHVVIVKKNFYTRGDHTGGDIGVLVPPANSPRLLALGKR